MNEYDMIKYLLVCPYGKEQQIKPMAHLSKQDVYDKCYEMQYELIKYKNIEEELGIDLITFLKGIDPNTCFMQITKDKKFYLCGDAYYGDYSKEELLKLIQELLFMYWALTREELE